MKKYIDNRYSLVFLILVILSVPFMWRGLYESSEGRYARVAQSMVESHDFWMPKLNGVPHLTKPPLTYWVIALGIDFFGDNTFGARIFHTLAWIITGLIIVRIGTELESPQMGLVSGLVFSSSLFPALGFWSLTTDPLLVFFEAFFLLALIRFEKEKSKQSAFVFWLMIGLALLTKGPVAMLPLPFLMLRWKIALWDLFKTHLWTMSLFIGISWYLLLEINNPGTLFRLTRDELILRATTDISGRNPFWWAPFAVYGIPFVIGWGFWPCLIKKKKDDAVFEAKSKSWQMAMLAWIIGGLLFFSVIQSRLTLYILPLTIPISLLLGYLIQFSKKIFIVTSINIIVLLALKTYGAYFYFSPDNSLQITNFAKPLIKDKPIHLLWEKSLYGLEYYLPKQFIKNIDPYSSFEANQNPSWVLYQKKRTKFFENLKHDKNFKIIETHSFFKWKLSKVSR